MATETITLENGKRLVVPSGLSDDQVQNIISKEFPTDASLYGGYYDIDKEYDTKTGIDSYDLRIRLSAASTPDEVKMVMDEQVGENNWFVSDVGNKIAVLPAGLQRMGQPVAEGDNRPRMVDGDFLELHDLTDIVPEATRFLATTIATLPMGGPVTGVLGTLIGRGLIGTSIRAGLGDMTANLGIEGVQELNGYNTESLSKILKEAGTEAGFVTLGTALIGAPLAAVGKTANMAKNAVKGAKAELPDKTFQGPNVSELLAAQNRIRAVVGDDDAMLISINSILSPEGGVTSNVLSRLEGTAMVSGGSGYADTIIQSLNKYRAIMRQGAEAGDDLVALSKRLKEGLTTAERNNLIKTAKSVEDYQTSKLGLQDEANSSIVGFKNYANAVIRNQRDKTSAVFSNSSKYFNAPELKGLDIVSVNKEQLVQVLNGITKKLNADGITMSSADVFQYLPASYKSRISSFAKIGDEGDDVFRVVKDKVGKDPETGVEFDIRNPKDTPNLTAGDLLSMDRRLRRESFASGSDEVQFKSMNISQALREGIEGIKGVRKNTVNVLNRVNKKYAEFKSVYKGQGGIEKNISQRVENDAEKILENLVNGTNGKDLVSVINNLDKAFGKGMPGVLENTLQTKNEILSSIGSNYIRETSVGLKNAIEAGTEIGAKEATRILAKIKNVETTLAKQVGAKGKDTFNRIFKNDTMTEYKSILNNVASKNPSKATLGVRQLEVIKSYKEGVKFTDDIAKTVSQLTSRKSLSGEELKNIVAQINDLDSLSAGSKTFIQEMVTAESFSKVLQASALKTPVDKMSAMSDWAEGIVTALSSGGRNSQNKFVNEPLLKELYGSYWDGMRDLALTLRGTTNIRGVGELSSAAQPFALLRGFLRLDPNAIAKPLSFMYSMNKLAPGSPAWKSMQAKLAAGRTGEDVAEDALKKGMAMTGDIVGKGLRFSEMVLNGRYGILAATVGSSIQEVHYSNSDLTDLPSVPPVGPSNPAQVVSQNVPDQATAEQQLGQNMVQQQALMNQLQGTQAVSPQQPARINPVQQGAQIAQNTQSAVGNPALSPSITANSIPNSFANLMGSINMGRG